MVQRRSVTNDISFSICKFSVSDLVVLRDNPFEVYIEVSFVLSFSSGETPNPQIDHETKYYWEGAFSDFFSKKKKRKKKEKITKIQKIRKIYHTKYLENMQMSLKIEMAKQKKTKCQNRKFESKALC